MHNGIISITYNCKRFCAAGGTNEIFALAGSGWSNKSGLKNCLRRNDR